ncbi:MAG: hypothetical protein QM674_19195 [Burkholderiaceae bacterium]
MQANRRKLFAIAPVALALGAPSVSFAQLGSLFGGKSAGSAGPDLSAQQDQLVRTYVAAGKDVHTANLHLCNALGIQAAQIDANASADSLSASDIEASDKAISDNAAAFAEALKSGAKLKNDEAKATYTKGLLSMASGVKKYLDMRSDAQGFASSLASASPLLIPKLKSAAYIAQNLPGSVSRMTDVLKNAIQFATSNGIPVPKDATSLI